MAKQIAFYVEQKFCVGCKTCQVACKDKHDLKVGQLYRRVSETAGGGFEIKGATVIPAVYAFWTSISCNHCGQPVCVENCPVGAVQKQAADGIVYIDQEKCVGCRKCVKSCPYGAPQYNRETRKTGKCDFCRDELAAGKPPVCVAACPLRALDYGPLNVLQRKYGKANETKGLPAGGQTQPALVIAPHRDAL
ncbi:DMSO/selenate family reductase complex B subunit [Sporomusa termitida]|uniref:Anaerobic dimethyl sulfoxide reductase chain B n=1 Tax=Sporomusa termitida TaxID=2377 RepID=A0A517DPX6_9FIRM|nr:DMSO/selenate family reductase complex B subunit [Sporomusa termitida]QDR79326.1 Anaerobic dimethyl sulfoxide reductase chain B [Sporomusa termitida]